MESYHTGVDTQERTTKETTLDVIPTISATSPHLSLLPFEICAEIFLLSCSSGLDILRYDSYMTTPPPATPFTLGAVSRHWRAIVQSTPQIWSDIFINLSSDHLDGHHASLANSLTLSKACPLSIGLRFKGDESGWSDTDSLHTPENPLIASFIHLLASSAPRWRSIDMTLPISWWPLLVTETRQLPELLSVRLEHLHWEVLKISQARREEEFSLLKPATKLQHLHLRDFWLPKTEVPWNQLTRLTLFGNPVRLWYVVLGKVPCLEWCRLVLPTPDRLVEQNFGPINLSHLRHFIFQEVDWYAERFSPFVADLVCSALKCIELISSPFFARHRSNKSNALTLLSISSHLTRLVLTDMELNDCLLEFVYTLRLLQELEVKLPRGNHTSPKVLKSVLLHQSPLKTYALPNLTKFSISGPFVLKNSRLDLSLLRLLRIRTRNYPRIISEHTKLLSFRLETGEKFKPSTDAIIKIQDLVEDGLQVRVVCGGIPWM